MKRIFLILSLTFILLTGCGTSNLKELSFSELKNRLEQKESFIIYFDKDDENILKTKLNKIVKEYNLNGYTINTTKITNDEKLEIQPLIDYEEPSIVFVINGLDPSKLSHITDKDTTIKDIIQRLKDINFIKEDTK